MSPKHSQPHERMMFDYLQEMSYAGPPESQDSALAALLKMTKKRTTEKIHLCPIVI